MMARGNAGSGKRGASIPMPAFERKYVRPSERTIGEMASEAPDPKREKTADGSALASMMSPRLAPREEKMANSRFLARKDE